ncbi:MULTISPECIES: response regulator transcription factor [unclassified Clostridioides]|uniref:response regulator transcription factor n=1 Tax=unclassified Clostridioides TaxID=2635829 RepID=UPI001D1175AD|nr:response regulator transcription factor [Clostridioides sp. ZZV15-6388]MCC0660945.1 response regulator transcription factor [Clostridioides sp. ZZV14-6154]MCC0665012.1 response regulator transcription factor [Clostridioides sp. ZZV15-6597]MCC0717579.1 response regulator transcription factor [Clostridioides sp. ZZV14-6105]MCC0725467.1 response regulator transcription factor [Clostridioides sp. ZZV14-6045]MCC0729582.1 response regulator transcription factor [Clostridioides sp. ZZV14-6048]MCC
MIKEIPKKILVADDNPEIREIVEILLTGEGYEVVMATNGEEAVNLVDSTIDLIILDVVMPVKTGFVACNEIREKTTAPILFLTAKTQDSDKVIGFSAGGDDYLSKPFSYSELISRVKSLLRRYYIYQGKEKNKEPNILQTKGLCVNLDTQDVILDGETIFLTTIEYSILVLMLKNRKKVFSSENIYESIWDEQYFYTANNTIMVHIRNLRKKLEKDQKNPQYVKTAWGKGYYID